MEREAKIVRVAAECAVALTWSDGFAVFGYVLDRTVMIFFGYFFSSLCSLPGTILVRVRKG